MKTLRYLACLFGAVAFGTACGPSMVTTVHVSKSSAAEDDLAAAVHRQVNAKRIAVGKQALRPHPALEDMAREHSEFLRVNRGKFGIYGANVSHYGFESRSFAARNRFRIEQSGENVVSAVSKGPDFPAYVVNLWLESPLHQKNMLSADWALSGIGVVLDTDGTAFITQMFGTEPHLESHRATVDRLRLH